MEEQKMAETFKLPSSSYEELIKLFQAYANTKEEYSKQGGRLG